MDDTVIEIDASMISARERCILVRRHKLHQKYAEAVELYAGSNMSVKDIAVRCGVGCKALSVYLQRYWRELMLRRHGIECRGNDPKSIKVISAGNQGLVAREKYKDAVAACDKIGYIDLNMSQIARKFGLNGTALSNFMRVHYSDILECREKLRRELGISGSKRRSAKERCANIYAEAVRLYGETDMTIGEIALRCEVSESGLQQHLRFYHRDLLARKREMRRNAAEKVKKGKGDMTGNGRRYEPSREIVAKYAVALDMYRNTSMTMKAIAEQTGVSREGLRSYLNKWYRSLVMERSGIDPDADDTADLRRLRRRMKTVAAKYAEAIESLKHNVRPVAKVAREFGLNANVFRQYLHKHEPELIKQHGHGT